MDDGMVSWLKNHGKSVHFLLTQSAHVNYIYSWYTGWASMRFMKNHSLNIVSPKYFVDCWFNSEKNTICNDQEKASSVYQCQCQFSQQSSWKCQPSCGKIWCASIEIGNQNPETFYGPATCFHRSWCPNCRVRPGVRNSLGKLSNLPCWVVGEKLCTRSPFTPLFLRGAEVLWAKLPWFMRACFFSSWWIRCLIAGMLSFMFSLIGGEGCISSGSWRVVCVPTTNSHLPWRLPLVVVGDLIHDRYWLGWK